MAVLEAPEREHASETSQLGRGPAAAKRKMRREFTEFDDEQDDDDRDRQHYVGDRHDQPVGPTAHISCDQSEGYADDDEDDNGLGSVQQRYPATEQDAAEDVATKVIGPE